MKRWHEYPSLCPRQTCFYRALCDEQRVHGAMEGRCGTIKDHQRSPRGHYSLRTTNSPHVDPWIGILIKNWEALHSSLTYPLFIDTGRRTAPSIYVFCSAQRGQPHLFVDDVKHFPGGGYWRYKNKKWWVEWAEESFQIQSAQKQAKNVFFFPHLYEFPTKREKKNICEKRRIFSLVRVRVCWFSSWEFD